MIAAVHCRVLYADYLISHLIYHISALRSSSYYIFFCCDKLVSPCSMSSRGKYDNFPVVD